MKKQITIKNIVYRYHDKYRYRCSKCHQSYYNPALDRFSGRHVKKMHLRHVSKKIDAAIQTDVPPNKFIKKEESENEETDPDKTLDYIKEY
jgi:hypothetical protein